jgi:methylthioribose-1-phosphate isomerase
MASPLRFDGEALELLDQTRLPFEQVWIRCGDARHVAEAITRLAVRGAPAIGIAAAYGLALGVAGAAERELRTRFDDAFELLGATRPTAVNLRWALERGRQAFEANADGGPRAAYTALVELARDLERAQREADRSIARAGVELFSTGDRVLTHCNAGGLATGGDGTAGGVIEAAWRAGRVERVWVDETRPLLQGARLTAWELGQAGVPFQIVTDASVGTLMARGLVDRVVVGADRIAANGDVANKIGTYTVAVVAARHGVPVYVAAPVSTIDRATPTGDEIVIEERDPAEVTHVLDRRLVPSEAPAANWAFDVTPHELIAAIVCERGVLRPPYDEAIGRLDD